MMVRAVAMRGHKATAEPPTLADVLATVGALVQATEKCGADVTDVRDACAEVAATVTRFATERIGRAL